MTEQGSGQAGRLPVAVRREPVPEVISEAVQSAGGRMVAPEEAEALLWLGGPAQELSEVLERGKNISWVQLPSAGVERYLGLVKDGRLWTCAKGIYARPVAEHALALALAGLHDLPRLARRRSWDDADYNGLYGAKVTAVGGGGIVLELIEMLRPFKTENTVVRRHPGEMDGVKRVLGAAELIEGLRDADVVVLAQALTPETQGSIGAEAFEVMKSSAWLVNVGRGKLVRTDDLVTALRGGAIGGAALDVTDPEPLPDGHPLWELDNCLITPHVANPDPDVYLAELVRDNVRRRIAGQDLRGKVDPQLGY